jgi:DNA-binding response OmpR family regulator
MTLEGKPLVLLGGSNRKLGTVLSSILEKQGIAIVMTNTPDEFLHSLDKHQAEVDLVCINGRLASERGGVLISRAKDAGKNVKVVVVADKDDDRADILRYGADEFILKPVSPNEIASTIAALVAKS